MCPFVTISVKEGRPREGNDEDDLSAIWWWGPLALRIAQNSYSSVPRIKSSYKMFLLVDYRMSLRRERDFFGIFLTVLVKQERGISCGYLYARCINTTERARYI